MAAETIRTMAANAREAGLVLSASSLDQRNQALLSIGKAIERHLGEIMAANERDVQKATEENLSAPMISRLRFGEAKSKRVRGRAAGACAFARSAQSYPICQRNRGRSQALSLFLPHRGDRHHFRKPSGRAGADQLTMLEKAATPCCSRAAVKRWKPTKRYARLYWKAHGKQACRMAGATSSIPAGCG